MADNKQTIDLNITYTSIFKIVLVLLFLVFLYLVRDIIALVFVSIILAAAISPVVDFFERKKIPRWIAILIVYLIAVSIISLALILLIPALAEQITQLASDFPNFYQRITQSFSQYRTDLLVEGETTFSNILQNWAADLSGAGKQIFSTIFGILGGFISFLAVLVITFYLLVDENASRKMVQTIVPGQHQNQVFGVLTRIQERIALWLQGQLMLSLIIAVLTLIGLLILGVKYALVLALVAGITELIPFVGPIIGAIPAVFIAFNQSPIKALFVIILYLVIQQVENQIVVPKVMGRVTGLSPVVIIISILIGGKIAGILGAIVAIPVALAVAVLVREFYDHRKAAPPAGTSNPL